MINISVNLVRWIIWACLYFYLWRFFWPITRSWKFQ